MVWYGMVRYNKVRYGELPYEVCKKEGPGRAVTGVEKKAKARLR
jgi:hypothetical protein